MTPPLCKSCHTNLRQYKETRNGKRIYKPRCRTCLGKNGGAKDTRRPWLAHRKDHCEECGFIPQHICQLDVDHLDGDKTNNDPSNYRTLCANCHRLKTYLSRDWQK